MYIYIDNFCAKEKMVKYKGKNITNTYVYNHLIKIQLTGGVKVFSLHILL
jgi:hypothetical protein